MNCPHCSRDISPNAKSCPHCGETDPLWGKIMTWLIGINVVFWGGLYLDQNHPWLFAFLILFGLVVIYLYVKDFFSKK